MGISENKNATLIINAAGDVKDIKSGIIVSQEVLDRAKRSLEIEAQKHIDAYRAEALKALSPASILIVANQMALYEKAVKPPILTSIPS